jgi:hypothetical protein
MSQKKQEIPGTSGTRSRNILGGLTRALVCAAQHRRDDCLEQTRCWAIALNLMKIVSKSKITIPPDDASGRV